MPANINLIKFVHGLSFFNYELFKFAFSSLESVPESVTERVTL